MPQLFEPLTLRSLTLRNRIGVSPMCQYQSHDGFASDWHLVHLGSRAIGGAALVIAEATAVEARGRISPQDLGIWKDAHIEPLARVVRFVSEHGAVAGIQLAHAGRKASTNVPWKGKGTPVDEKNGGWKAVGPSPIPFHESLPAPTELTLAEIRSIQSAFREATVRAKEAGFQWVELHAAHGYLAHSFLSPLSNQRRDEYGGSFENRIRFVLEVAESMRAIWPDRLPMSVRLSVTDWAQGGWDTEQSVELAKRLKVAGIDLIDCSSGGLVSGVSYPMGPGYQVPLSEAVRSQAQIPTAAVGKITDPAQAEAIVREAKADLVFLATQMLEDPYWSWHAARALGQTGGLKMPDAYDYVLRAMKV